VNIYKRLILVTPFVLLTGYFIKHRLRTEGCDGFVEIFFNLILFFLIAISIVLCVIVITRKREKFEKISLTITLLTILTLIVILIIGDKIYGRVWLISQTFNDRHEISRQKITLRKNKTFRYDLIEADYSCFASGSFSIQGDTLNLDKGTIEKSNGKLTTTYILTKTFLIPIEDKNLKNKTFDTLLIER
jgi:hypothetical protein